MNTHAPTHQWKYEGEVTRLFDYAPKRPTGYKNRLKRASRRPIRGDSMFHNEDAIWLRGR